MVWITPRRQKQRVSSRTKHAAMESIFLIDESCITQFVYTPLFLHLYVYILVYLINSNYNHREFKINNARVQLRQFYDGVVTLNKMVPFGSQLYFTPVQCTRDETKVTLLMIICVLLCVGFV